MIVIISNLLCKVKNSIITMNKDTINLINHSASTFLNIAQMTQYRMKYLQDRDPNAKEKMYKHALLVGVGIVSLLTIGIVGVLESHRNDIPKWL